jgi:CRISPR-associated protein Csm1
LDVVGFGLRTTSSDRPAPPARFVFALTGQYPLSDGRIVPRRLARHIPRQPNQQPVEFKDLAARAVGAPLLGVLKLDADNLGAAFRRTVQEAFDFGNLRRLSERLDDFFARQVDNLLARPPWDTLYMVFSGGDDLLLVGPWNVAFDFAGHVQQRFARAFADDGLTLSGGLALFKPTFPIRSAADQADNLLDAAKAIPAPGATAPKDQMAAFGQVWKWSDHPTVVSTAARLADWVRQDVMPRGWLHTLLDLAEARNQGDAAPVTARLAYHIGRNYPPATAEGPRGELRRWANALLDDFDAGHRAETRLLPAILRHALTATRSPSRDEP